MRGRGKVTALAVATAAVVLAAGVAVACSSGGGSTTGGGSSLTGAGGATGAGSTGAGGATGAGSTGAGAASSVPNPCELLTGADVTAAMGDAGYSTTVADGTLVPTASEAEAGCLFQDANGLEFQFQLCTTSFCDFDVLRAAFEAGGLADAVSGVGDDAFFASTCEGPDFLRHDQLYATAKGLVFSFHIGCLTSSTISQDGSDQALTGLVQLAISRA
jgi:hypothetical protein